MSITDELREYFGKSKGTFTDYVLSIADRIDAEHERAVMSAMNDALYHANDESMSELGWIRLPKDADGEPIHVGDELDYLEALHPDVPSRFKVQDMFYSGNGEWRLRAYPATYEPEKCRHYHAPTVEDVLREFANEVYADADNEIRDRDFLCAKYAKRLTLAETEDA